MKKCIRCGSQLDDTANYCFACSASQLEQKEPINNGINSDNVPQKTSESNETMYRLFNTYIRFLFIKLSLGTILSFILPFGLFFVIDMFILGGTGIAMGVGLVAGIIVSIVLTGKYKIKS